MFKYRLRNSSNTLSQVIKTTISRIILNNRYTSFRTIPLGLMNLYKTISRIISCLSSLCPSIWWLNCTLRIAKVVLPVCNPIDKHLSNLNISNRNLFDGINFQRWCMEHFFDCAWCRLKNSKSNHLIKSKRHVDLALSILRFDLLLHKLLLRVTLMMRHLLYLIYIFRA